LRHRELLGLSFGQSHAGKVVSRQRLQAETTLACRQLQSSIVENKTDIGTLRQGTKDFLQLSRAHRHRPIALTDSSRAPGCNLNLDVRREKRQYVPLFSSSTLERIGSV
jgi:hypothetical protein